MITYVIVPVNIFLILVDIKVS